MDENERYNSDVVALFTELVKANKVSLYALNDIEIEVLGKVAKALSANKPQVY